MLKGTEYEISVILIESLRSISFAFSIFILLKYAIGEVDFFLRNADSSEDSEMEKCLHRVCSVIFSVMCSFM